MKYNRGRLNDSTADGQVTNMMDGYWFSTQTVGHCNATDGGAAAADAGVAGAEQCTWRVPQV